MGVSTTLCQAPSNASVGTSTLRVFSSLLALIGINKIETQTRLDVGQLPAQIG